MILVTGGTGLVGAHLIVKLLRQTNTPIRVVTSSENSIEKLRTVAQQTQGFNADLLQKIEWVVCDIVDRIKLGKAFENISEVYHCAASVSFNPKHEERIMDTNVDGTANIVNLSLEHNIQKFCHVSSIAAIGGNAQSVRNEKDDWDPGASRSFYSLSKYLSEMEVWRGIAEGLPATIVNPSVIIGSGVWGQSSTAFFTRIWNGLRYYTPGGTGFVDVDDLTNIMLSLMEKKKWGERYIVNSENVSYKDFFAWVANSIDKNVPQKQLSSLLASFAWRLDKLRCVITGANPKFTKTNKRTAFTTSLYSNEKVKAELGIDFKPVKESVSQVGRVFLQSKA